MSKLFRNVNLRQKKRYRTKYTLGMLYKLTRPPNKESPTTGNEFQRMLL